MRFPNIEKASINDLLLDEKNYRFSSAANQQACIEKIYAQSPSSFSNMMSSIAEDDLGELLLVYREAENTPLIVVDGNRRTAALKVLHNPDLSPTPTLKKKAEDLLSSTKIDFDNIQIQVSSDKQLIFKTVYERHAAGKGVSKIDWNALANAKFRFDNKADDQDWKAVALLMELVSQDDPIIEFVDSSKYSHDVFRRIVRAAIQKDIISRALFSQTNMRINKSKKSQLANALKLSKAFLNYMKDGKINLSRNGDTYADKGKVDAYLQQFIIVPKSPSNNDSTPEASTTSGSSGGEAPDDTKHKSENNGSNKKTKLNTKKPVQIEKSEKIVVLLNNLNSGKLTSLYNSLTSLYFNTHPSLICIGAWAFFETLSRNLGANDQSSFESFLGTKLHEWFPADKGKKKSMKQSMKFISEEGNCNKHCEIYYTVNAAPLANHFQVLEPLIIKALEVLVSKKASD